ncbi:MAG: PAS domain S-box protein [Paludibacter sp.]|nr:PAS domain S-box protein [Paludibacter sp.]
MNSEFKTKATYLREKAEKLLRNRSNIPIKKSSDSEIIKLLSELELYSLELESETEVIINAQNELKDEVKKYTISEPEVLKLIHELDVYQIELDLQNSELALTQTVSQNVAERYTDIFHFSTSGYLILSNEGEIIDLNTSGAKMLGKGRLDLKNSRFGFFVSDDHKSEFNNFLQNIFTYKSKASCELSLDFEDSNSIFVHLSGIVTQDDQQCLMSIIDITEQKQTDIYRGMTSEILQILNQAKDLDETIQQTIKILKNRIGFDKVGLRLQKGEDFPYLVHEGYSIEFLNTENSLFEMDTKGNVYKDKYGNPKLACTCGLVISGETNKLGVNITSGGSWWTNDSSTILDIPSNKEKRFKPRNICALKGYTSAALIPIKVNSVVVGLIQLLDKRKDRFNQNTIEILEGIATHIGSLITRKQAEDLLQKNEELLRTITQNAPDILIQLDRKGSVLYINREMHGYACEYYIGKSIYDLILSEYQEKMKKSLELVFNDAISLTLNLKEKTKNDEIRDIRVSISPVKEYDKVASAILISRDITESIIAEKTIKHDLEQHRTILQTAIDGFMLVYIDGQIIDVNDSYCKMSGYTANELLSMRITDLDKLFSETEIAHKINKKHKCIFETEHRRKDGKTFYVEISAQYQTDNENLLVFFLHDITKRKRNEKKIIESEERYKSLFRDNNSVMLIINPDTREIDDANSAACDYYGWLHSELCQKKISDINIISDEEAYKYLQITKKKKSAHLFFKHKLANGEIKDVEVYSGSISFHDKTKIYEIIHDVTETKKLEDALRESERKLMEVYNSMSDGLAIHDIVYDNDGKVIDSIINEVNPAFEKIIGVKRNEFIGKRVSETIIKRMPFFLEHYINVEQTGQPTYFDFFDERTNKYLSFSVFTQEKGKFLTVIRNVTFQKQAEDAILKSERNLSDIYNSMSEGLAIHEIIYDSNGKAIDYRIQEINPAYEKILGLKRPDVKGKKATEVYSVDSAPYLDIFYQVATTGISTSFEEYFAPLNKYFSISVFSPENGKFATVFQDITERKHSENAIVESEVKFRRLVSDMHVGVLLQGLKSEVILCNPKACELLGLTQEQINSKSVLNDDWNAIYEDGTPFPGNKMPVHQAITTGKSVRNVVLGIKNATTNDFVWLLVDAEPQHDENETVFQVVCTFIDITQLKETENKLRESEQRLNYHFENSPLAIVEWDNNFNVTQWSVEAERIFGWKKEETIGKQIYELNLIYEEDLSQVSDTIKTLSGGNENIVVNTNRNVTKSGEVIHCTWYSSVLTNENGQMSSIMSLVQDITKVKQAEEALRESEEKFSLVFEKSPYVILLSSLSEGLVDVNEAFVNTFGFSKQDAIGKEIQELGFDMGSELIEKIILEMSKSGFIYNQESIFKNKNGEERFFRFNIDAFQSGNKNYTLTTAEDITERKEIEEALRESEYFFRESQKAAFIGSYKTDFTSGMWESSEVLDQIFGIDKSYNRNIESWLKITHPDDRKMMNKYLNNEVILKSVIFNKEYRIIRKNDGEIRWVHGNGKIDFDSNNDVKSLVGTIQDITERKLKEETLRKLNKTLLALSKSSKAMTQTTDEADYLKQVCKIVVEDTGFPMVWIGFAQDDDAKTILPVASAGFKDHYLETIKLSWDDSKHGRGQTGTVIRTGQMSICNNMYTDPTFEPWRKHALKRGFASVSVFPLITSEKAFGAISIYSKEPEAFLDVEIKMLSELANDLANGITTIRLRAAHQLSEKALNKSYVELEVLVKERTSELQVTNNLLNKEINIRKQKEEFLKLTEEKYRTVADFATNWEFWIAQDSTMLYCSPSCERITGYNVTEFVQNSNLFSSIIHPDDFEMYNNHQKKELKAQIFDHEIQYRIIKKDGTVRWISHFCQPIYNSSGLFSGTRGSNKDISVRKKMEELLKESNRKYNLLSENISDGIFILKKGAFDYVNQSVCDIFGYTREELAGMKLTQFIAPDQQAELDDFFESTTSKINFIRTFEVECLKKNSSNIHVEIILNYISIEKVVYGVIHDITEKKLIQKSIVKAIIRTEEKERTHFSKELHDGLGPLLSTIKLYLQWSERPNPNMSHTEIIKNAESILEEAITTVREISYKMSPHLLTNYGLNSAIKNFVDKIKATSSIKINFESNYNERLDIEIEATLYRAIIECINNSIKHSEARNISIKIEMIDQQLHLTYKDDGVGFDISETLSKQKGLGLFNLQNRINTIGGKLNMMSGPGLGVDYHFIINI